jgi:hypothetical protein
MQYNASWEQKAYYSTNTGATWTVIPVTPTMDAWGMGIVTGNAAIPFILLATTSASSTYSYALLSTSASFANSLTQSSYTVGGAGSGSYYSFWNIARKRQGFIGLSSSGSINSSVGPQLVPITTDNYWMIAPNTVDLTNSANWVQSATSTLGQMNDFCYFNGSFYAVGYGGIAVAPAGGTSTNPTGPTSAWGTVVNTGTSSVYAIDTNGEIMVAVGMDPTTQTMGAIWTSTNGITWTKVNRILDSTPSTPAGYTGAALNNGYFSNVFWDGARFVATGSYQAAVIAVSPDGINWEALYYPDFPENAGTNIASGLGLYVGAISAAGVYTSTEGGAAGVVLTAAAVASNARVVSPGIASTTSADIVTQTPTASVSVASGVSLSHYYELIFTATSTANQFTVQWALDGVIQAGTAFTFTPAPSTDTTSQAIFNLPRSGNWVVIDDIYLTDFAADPVGNTGQLGVVNVIAGEPTSDVQDQWTLSGSASSHAAQMATSLSNSEGSIYTYTVGGKDIYALGNSIPANYRIQAMQVEAYFSKYGTAGASGTVGVLSKTTEVDSAAVAAPTTANVFASMIQTVDPNTGVQWTAAGVQAAEITITKVT